MIRGIGTEKIGFDGDLRIFDASNRPDAGKPVNSSNL